MNKKQLKIVTGVAIAVLIISIIPMLWISQYLHPFADDYVFGAEVYKIHGRAPIPPAFSWLYNQEYSANIGLEHSS